MANISEYIPKYYKRTEDFAELGDAYDAKLQPLINSIKQTFKNCKAPILFSEYELRPLLAAAGYIEAYDLSLDDMRSLFLDILQNRRLMTDVAFVKQLRRVFTQSAQGTDYWTLDINREHNISVTVDCGIGNLSKSVTGQSYELFIYDLLVKNILNSFPAGVRLLLNANMTDTHTNYLGALPTLTVLMTLETGTIEPPVTAVHLYHLLTSTTDTEMNAAPSFEVIAAGGSLIGSPRSIADLSSSMPSMSSIAAGGSLIGSPRSIIDVGTGSQSLYDMTLQPDTTA